MSSAAIAVFAYRRPSHLTRVLRALQLQLRQTPLPVHLFLDAPRGEWDAAAVSACRNVGEQLAGSIDLRLHTALVNHGLYRALTEGVSAVLELHPEVIVLEDDILTSSHFLPYMLDGLRCYADEPRVASIHGYTPPILAELPDTFFLRGADCWGWATWRDRWKLFRSDAAAMAAEIRGRGLSADFDFGGRVPNLQLLDDRAAGRSASWAICWHASCFLADRFSLHPGRSLVRNIGLDSSGEHCAPSPELEASLTDRPVPVLRLPVHETQRIVVLFAKQRARLPLKRRLVRRLLPVRQRLRRRLARTLRLVRPSRLPLRGPYPSYAMALADATGYNSISIAAQVESAVRALVHGEIAYERDGVGFQHIPEGLIIRQLLASHLKPHDVVVDFGGGLGGTFLNHADLFPSGCHQIVVEQPLFVERGRTLSSSLALNVHFQNCLEGIEGADVILASSVLQYLGNYVDVLRAMVALRPRLIILDRTAFASKEHWYVQICPGYGEGDAQIPIRPIQRAKLLDILSGYRLQQQWTNPFDPGSPEHAGLLFELEEEV